MKDNVNLYTYVANSPVGYVDRMGLAKLIFWAIEGAKSIQIDLVSRALDSAVWSVWSHSFIEFTIQNNDWNIHSYSVWGNKVNGKLIALFNDPNDVGWIKKKERQNIAIPAWMTDKEFATQLVNEAVFYNQNPKDYALLSADNWSDTEWNCHNFSTTMLMRASHYSPNVFSTTKDFDPSGANPWLWEYFVPACTE